MSFRRGVVLAFFISKGKVTIMAKTHFHSEPQQRWFKPSASTGVRFAQYGATLGTRYGPQGVVLGGAIGFVTGAVIGGVLDELDVI